MPHEELTCPHCERPLLLPADATLDMPFPHCARLLGQSIHGPVKLFNCPECEQSVWLRPDAPTGMTCPHCGHLLGAVNLKSFQMPPPWDLANAESIDLGAMVPSVAALERVDESTARQLGVFPVDLDSGTLVLAVPADVELETLDKLRFVLNCDIRPVLAPAEAIRSAIDLWYR